MPPLPPGARHAHFAPPPVPPHPIPWRPQPYEWWYFEFHTKAAPLDAAGRPDPALAPVDDWVVVVSCHRPHFFDPVRLVDVSMADHPGGHPVYDPFAYSGIATSVYRLSPTVPLIDALVGFSATRTADADAETDPARPFTARFGRNPTKARIQQTGTTPLTYELSVVQEGFYTTSGLVDTVFRGRKVRKVEIRIDVTLRQTTPGFAVTPDAVLMTDKWGGRHHWAVVMPSARVTGTLTIRDAQRTYVEIPVDSRAYHDHQWGPHLPLVVMKDWSWGRALVHPDRTPNPDEEDLIVYFHAEPLPGAGAHGGTYLAYAPQGDDARVLVPTDPATPVVRLGGWDDANYPLRGFDPAQVRWPAERALPSVSGSVVTAGPPRSGPPFPVPPDDSRRAPLRELVMALARPLARRSLAGTVGYHGIVACQGASPIAADPKIPEPVAASFIQRGSTVEPWPFYNRYVPAVAVSEPVTGARRHRVTFGLSEYMEIAELMQKPPWYIGGVPVRTSLLGVAGFSEAMTQIEPGAPRLWPVVKGHLF